MNKNYFNLKMLALLLLISFLLIFPSCRTSPKSKYIKDGKPYGVVHGLFRERWWNFYERGASFSEGEFWNEAIADFQEAIKQRDKDQRRARTYGMHFMDYFPHRDLGVAYYNIGDYEKALKELEYSLSTIDTGKAKFYLNKVRQAMLQKSAVDLEPPQIKIFEPKQGEITNKFSLLIQGEVEDDTFAASIMVNNAPLFIELSSKRVPFTKEIKLKEGMNEIKVTSSDLTGKKSEETIQVKADFIGPSINISNYLNGEEVEQERIVLNGSLTDDTGIASLKINQNSIVYHQEKEVILSLAVDLKKGENKILISATDSAGNETKGELTLNYIPKQAKRGISKRKNPIMLVDLNLGVLDTGGNPILFQRVTSQEMGTLPAIAMKDLTESQKVFYDTIFIDGTAMGTNQIVRFEVNGEPLTIKPGKNIFFSYLAQLKEGENRFTFKAIDGKGLISSKIVTIIREVSKVMDIGSRMSITLLPLEQKGEVSPAASMVYDGLIDSFSKLNRFNIVSRGAELEAILKELKLSQTDLVDKSKALQVGKLAAAEAVISGSVIETKKDIEIVTRLINTETSSIMATHDVYSQEKSLSNLQFILNGLALKFQHTFPLAEGLVVKIKGKELFTDLGKNKSLKKDMKLIVYREGEKIVHPVTGKVLGCDTEILGEAVVNQVFDDFSKGSLSIAGESPKIREKDRVITK